MDKVLGADPYPPTMILVFKNILKSDKEVQAASIYCPTPWLLIHLPPLARDRKFHPNKRHNVTLLNSLLLWYYMDEIAAKHHVFYIWNVGEAALVSSGRRHLGVALPGWLWGNDTSLQPPFSSVQHPPTNNSGRKFMKSRISNACIEQKKFLSICRDWAKDLAWGQGSLSIWFLWFHE